MEKKIAKIVFDVLERILIVAESILGIRFILRLLGANPETAIVKLFYAVTDFLIAPFAGIFRDAKLWGGVLDLVVISAAVAYALAFFILKAIFVRK